jgi:uncharacterized protein YfaS (alpha-2-macroglobulin family)
VSADPRDKTLAPGGETKVDLTVKDFQGEPVANSEVAVVVVDESVLALARYVIGDPADTFLHGAGAGVTDYHLRKDILLGNPDDVKKPPPPPVEGVATGRGAAQNMAGAKYALRKSAEAPAAMAADMAMSEERERDDRSETKSDVPINLRETLTLWPFSLRPSKLTQNGRATVDIKLPDNLTRYRITAVSVDTAKRFGKAESTITAKQPLMVRPSAPRFMNFGDKVERAGRGAEHNRQRHGRSMSQSARQRRAYAVPILSEARTQ